MIVEEKGKLYDINEETGLVTEASFVEDIENLEEELRLGDRVEVLGHVGDIITMVPNVYGLSFGVRFDDGTFDEFSEQQLKKTAAQKVAKYDSPILELFGRYAAYETLPSYTPEEIETKEAEARWLNLQAHALRTGISGSGTVDPKLEEIVMVTQTDLRDLKDYRESVASTSGQEYTTRMAKNRYKLAEEIEDFGASIGGSDDMSWVTEIKDVEVPETTDSILAGRATEIVSSLDRDQLEDDEFIQVVTSYQKNYLQMTEEQAKKFEFYLSAARKARIKEPVEKTASTEYNLDDATDIFI